jgi:hypothetical protein
MSMGLRADGHANGGVMRLLDGFTRGAARSGRGGGARSLPAGLGLLLLLAAVAGVAASPALAAVGNYRCPDATRVYMGNARLFQSPCHIEADAIYRQIAEYREILDKGLTDRDVNYHFLMKKAAAKFNAAVRAMAREHHHDLVAEVGTIAKARDDAPDVPDRTAQAIAALQ